MDNRRDQSQATRVPTGQAAASPALRHLSHDIRLAMSDVIGGLRLMDGSRLDPQTLTQLDRVRSAADTLAALVDHALFAAAGESPLVRDAGPVWLDHWLETLEHRWGGQAAEHRRALRVRQAEDVPETLNVPPVALTRVVGNLVGNALRHVPEGDVDVVVERTADGGVVIAVHDRGPGFPAEVLAGTAEGGQGPNAGSGLGLKIARDLSAGFGASLGFENSPEGGCATLRMSAEVVVSPQVPTPVPAPNLPDLSALRILVAEDNLTNQTILGHMLNAMGGEAVFVADGRTALARLSDEPFDIALLDIEMPELSGLEVMEAVRAMGDARAAMPLVAITAYVLRDNREAIYAAGADGIIGKPIASTADLGRAILRHVRHDGPLEAALDPDAPTEPEGLRMDHARMTQLLQAAGPEGRQELLDRLSEDLATTLATMDHAMAEGDATELRAQTHILIAISGAVGADRLCQLAETLNIAAKRRVTERFDALYAPLRADLLALIADVAQRREDLATPG